MTARATPGDAACGDPRVAALVAHVESVANGAMRGMPVMHRALRVEAVGFAPMPGEAAGSGALLGALLGVLIAPWYMNLVWLPATDQAATECPRPGEKTLRRVGAVDFEWIGAHAPGVGAHACCSLFSPMFEFADHESATATARAALAQLREGSAPPPRASRRAFLLRPGAFGSAA